MARERRPVFAGGKKVEYHFGKKDPHNKSFEEFIMSPQALKPTMQVAKAIARRAKVNSPRSGDGDGVPYADSFEVKAKPKGIVADVRFRNRRVAVEVINTARHAPVIEFGLRDGGAGSQPSRRVLLRSGLGFASGEGRGR